MTQRTVTNQAECHRILMEEGVLGRIQPADPNTPGTIGLVPSKNPGTWCLTDKFDGHYTIVVLTEVKGKEAVAFCMDYITNKKVKLLNYREKVIERTTEQNN